MNENEHTTDAQPSTENAAPAEDLDAETLQNIAARHDSHAEREAAIADRLEPREGARSVNPEDDATREAYEALELHKIDDEELIADLFHAAPDVGDSIEGTRRDDVMYAADRRMEELCNDDVEPLVEPEGDTEKPTTEEIVEELALDGDRELLDDADRVKQKDEGRIEVEHDGSDGTVIVQLVPQMAWRGEESNLGLIPDENVQAMTTDVNGD